MINIKNNILLTIDAGGFASRDLQAAEPLRKIFERVYLPFTARSPCPAAPCSTELRHRLCRPGY